VDSGKTTLSEAMLYRAGAIRKLGRVDHKDAFLDTDARSFFMVCSLFRYRSILL
jgi:ribosomal protection tetracycline resistance protein